MRHWCKEKDLPVADPSGSSSVIKQELDTKLSPEVLWGQKNLIDIQSPTESENSPLYGTRIQKLNQKAYPRTPLSAPSPNAIIDQLENTNSNRPRSHSSMHSSTQMAECNSKLPSPHAQCLSKEVSIDLTSSGISQEILTRLHLNNSSSKNVDYTPPNYPSATEILSPTCSSTPTMEADSSVVSSSENVLCVGTRVLAAWDRFRYYNGVIYKIDDERIHVAFDMGGLKKYPLDCKDKIVIDRKALPNELVKDTPILVKRARTKALYKGQILSSGTMRGYCIIFDDPRRDREWKRTKSLRVITDNVVVKGGPKLDNRDDTSCTSKEENATFTSKNNAINLPSQSTEQGSHNFQYAIPKSKIFHSGLPTVVPYGQSTLLHLPESTTDDRRITSEIQSQDEYSVQQSSNLYSQVSTGLQSNRAGLLSNLTDFHSSVSRSETKLQSCVHDSRSNATSYQSSVADPPANLTTFQSDFAGSRSNRTCFQYDGLDPWTNLTSCQSTTGFHSHEANFQSKFSQDILNYFPKRQNVSSSMERKNMNCTVGNIHSPIMNMAGNNHQRLIPLYIGGTTSDGNAVNYPLPTHSSTPSPFTVGATDYHVFVPIEGPRCGDSSEIFSYESEDAPKVNWPSGSSMVYNQESESVLTKYNSNLWPSFYTTEERSPCSFQDGICTPNKPRRLPISSDYAAFNQDMTYSIKQEQKSPCRFLVPSKINTLSNPSYYDTQCFRQFDSPEGNVYGKKYFREVLSTCSTSTHSTRPTRAMESEQMMEDISPPLCCRVPLQPLMSTTDGMGSAYTIAPAYQAKLAYFIPPIHLEPPTYPNSPANFTPAYPTQPAFPAQPAPPQPAQPPQPTQPPHPTQSAYPTQRVHQIQPAHLTTPSLPSYPYMPLITEVECSAQLASLNQTEMNNSQYLSSTKTSQNANCEWLDEQDFENPNAALAVYFPPTGQNYTFQSLSKVSGKNGEHDRRRPSESPSSPVTFNSQPNECSDFIKFPLTREERKRKILSAFGFENVQTSTSSNSSSKFSKVGEEETIPTSKNIIKNNSTLPLVSKSNDSIHPSQESATTSTDANVSRTAQDTTASIRKDGESDDVHCCLLCDEIINENYIEPNFETLPPKEKSKEEMAVQLQITSQHVGVKFVDEATIFLYSEAQPSRFLTCL